MHTVAKSIFLPETAVLVNCVQRSDNWMWLPTFRVIGLSQAFHPLLHLCLFLCPACGNKPSDQTIQRHITAAQTPRPIRPTSENDKDTRTTAIHKLLTTRSFMTGLSWLLQTAKAKVKPSRDLGCLYFIPGCDTGEGGMGGGGGRKDKEQKGTGV